MIEALEESVMRKLFQFNIRDLFWLTLFVAIAGGWMIDHHKLCNQVLDLERKSKLSSGLNGTGLGQIVGDANSQPHDPSAKQVE